MSGEADTRPVKARADMQMRVVLDVDSYAEAGALMDDIEDAIGGLLAGRRRARFDFVAFNTHPCKAIDMDRQAMDIDRPMMEIGQPPY